jgi:hypothetical protein
LQTTGRQASGVEGNFILQSGAGELNGYPLAVTTNVTSTFEKRLLLICLQWFLEISASWLLLLGVEWNLLLILSAELLPGLTNKVLNAYMDVNLLQPKAFAVCGTSMLNLHERLTVCLGWLNFDHPRSNYESEIC